MKCVLITTTSPFVYCVKLKLEFIVLNQLQSLVKRGLTPGLGLTLGSNLSVSDSRGSDPTAATQRNGGQKPIPVFDRGFITKTGVASSVSGSESEKPRHGKHDSAVRVKATEDEHDLRTVMGQPDAGGTVRVDDIERQYLGTWGSEAKP